MEGLIVIVAIILIVVVTVWIKEIQTEKKEKQDCELFYNDEIKKIGLRRIENNKFDHGLMKMNRNIIYISPTPFIKLNKKYPFYALMSDGKTKKLINSTTDFGKLLLKKYEETYYS